MAFNQVGTVITQSGTDLNLSGLSGLTGVTVVTSGSTSLYNISSNRIDVTGTLTIDPLDNILICNNGVRGLEVSGGTLNLGTIRTVNSYDYSNPLTAYINTGSPSGWFRPGVSGQSDGALLVSGATSTLNIINCTLQFLSGSAANGFLFDSSASVNITNGRVISGQGIAPTGRNIISGIHTNNANINGFEIIGGELILGSTSATSTIAGLTRLASAIGVFPNQGLDFNITNLDVGNRGNVVDVSIQTDGNLAPGITKTNVVNSASGNNLIIVGAEGGTDARNQGSVRVQKQVGISSFDTSGAPVQNAKFFIRDTNNGQRKDLNNLDDTADKTYTGISNVNGIFSQQLVDTMIVNVEGTNPRGVTNSGAYRMDFRGKNDSILTADIPDNTAEFDINFISYLHNIGVTTTNFVGLDVLQITLSLISDTSITEVNDVTVRAYSEINSPNRLYDYAKTLLFDDFNGESNTIVSRSGNTIDMNDLNLIIDSTAAQVFNMSGDTITVRADTFVGNITTTGLVTLQNGATVNGIVTDSTGTSVSINVNGIRSGSRLQIYDTTNNNEIFNGIVNDTSYVQSFLYTSDVDIRVRLAFQSGVVSTREFETIGTITSTGFSTTAAQVDDTVYTANNIDGSTVTEFTADYVNIHIDVNDLDNSTTVQRIYAWYKAEIMSVQGIQDVFGSILAEDTVNYRIVTSVATVLIDNNRVQPVLIVGGRIIRDDGVSVIAPTSNSIQIDPDKAFVANSSAITNSLNRVENNTTLIPALL